MALLVFKQERRVELWVKNNDRWRNINNYDMTAISGTSGPKLREGDRQIPEGIYNIIELNPNSSYHLSMKLNYPNEFDLDHAQREGRTEPGSDIYMHGKAASVGCIAVGDPAIEELFVLADRTGIDHIRVIISPYDARGSSLLPVPDGLPEWTPTLYKQIERELSIFSMATDQQ